MTKELLLPKNELAIPQEFQNIEAFQAVVSQNPSPKHTLKNHPSNGGGFYLPIQVIETYLDKCFAGLWQVHSFNYQVIANELVGDITLEVFHPVAQVWIKRTGAAAIPIMQDKGADIMDIGKKKQKALVVNHPTLKAMCLKNAAQSLGSLFGRDLGRKEEHVLATYKTSNQEVAEQTIIDSVQTCSSIEELMDLYTQAGEFVNDKEVKKAFSKRKSELK